MSEETPEALSAAELADRIEAGESVSVLDVRNREEVDTWRIDGPGVEFTNVPYMRFLSTRVSGTVAELVDPDEQYVVVCPHGEASAEVAEDLRAAGVDARNLEGGMYEWARVYRSSEVSVEAETTVRQYRRPASGCLGYLLVADGEAVVVDPLAAFVDRYAADTDEIGATIEYVVDTHVHADHISGVSALAEETDATAVLSEASVDRGVTFDAETVTDGDTLPIGDSQLDVLETPGHTTGSVSLFLEGELLIPGDTLFLDGSPRPDLEAGDEGAAAAAGQLYDSLNDRLGSLDDEVLVAPGHYTPGRPPGADGTYTAVLGELRERLVAFTDPRETFRDRITASMGPRPANFERIVEINLGREPVDSDDAFELELGPNNCAVAAD